MNYLEKPNQANYGFTLYRTKLGFDLDVEYWDEYRGFENEVTLDALEVYNHLKAYFKGTEHE